MPNPTAIVNPAGDNPETILHYAKKLGTNVIRRKIFDNIYGRAKKPRSKKQIMSAAAIPAVKAQEAQNALEHLANHHLISRGENDGRVKDGSRLLYGKLETIRAHKAEIVRYADHPRAAKTVATKRRPYISNAPASNNVTKRNLEKLEPLVVLYLISNPDPGPDVKKHIRPEAEVRIVQEEVRGSKFAENIDIQLRLAADVTTILQGLNDLSPQIVHFSGHSNSSVLVTDSGAVASPAKTFLHYDTFAKALAATDRGPRVVVLNSCLSASARTEVLKSVEVMIGMTDSVSDLAAAAFAPKFYAAIASGQSLESAFKQGVVAVEAASISEKNVPKMFLRTGVDASKIKLIK